eukprot:TRINITY_DN77358_c0_g1_i1.p1 TRINITY_DN77358_c0_g1~~TRINITY_DN77358_c0_g1_i1.p1  ORF type:complete len:683 (+),score=151.43 TRINITY_DN77358_c0_g1_i1:69-2117(+)
MEIGAENSNEIQKSRACNRCGKEFKGKASLKRHKKRCINKKEVESFICPYCNQNVRNKEHERECSVFQKHFLGFQSCKPNRAEYFTDIDFDEVPETVVVRLISFLSKREKSTMFEINTGKKDILNIFIHNCCGINVYKEYFKDMPFETLLMKKEVLDVEIHAESLCGLGGALNRFPKFPVDCFAYFIENLRDNKDMIALLNANTLIVGEYATGEHLKIILKYLNEKALFDVILRAAVSNFEHKNEVVVETWKEIMKRPSCITLLETNNVHMAILKVILGARTNLKYGSIEAVLTEMPKSFHAGFEKALSDKLFNTQAPEIRKLIRDHCGLQLSYELGDPSTSQPSRSEFEIESLLSEKVLDEVLTAKLLRGDSQVELATMLKENNYNLTEHQKKYCSHYDSKLLVCQGNSRSDFSSKVFSFIGQVVLDFASNSSVARLSCLGDHIKYFFDSICGIETKGFAELLTSDSTRNDEFIQKVPFYMKCCELGEFPPLFFDKEFRIKHLILFGELEYKKGNLIEAVNYWKRALRSDIEETIRQMKSHDLGDWCQMVSKLQKAEEFTTAIACCDVGILTNMTNPDRFVLFHARGKIHRSLREIYLAQMDFESCLKLKPDLIPAMFEYGVCCALMDDYQGASDAFYRVLKLDPSHDLAKIALINIVAKAKNFDELKVGVYKFLFDSEDK